MKISTTHSPANKTKIRTFGHPKPTSIQWTKNFTLILLLLVVNMGMAQTSKDALKSYFRQGNAPTEVHFNELVEACYNYSVGQGLIIKDNTLQAEFLWQDIEKALQDTAQVLRTTMNNFHYSLQNEINVQSTQTQNLLDEQKSILFGKIDSLAQVHSLYITRQQKSIDTLRSNHQKLSNTTLYMKQKLDTLNYTEQNFTLFLKNKLDNIQEGATISDNNFADSLLTKLMGIEKHANNYQLPLGTHSRLGGIKLSPDFILYQGRAYNALDPDKIDRQYATDTIVGNWTQEMKTGDLWTRIRLKLPTGETDPQGNKIFNYGEWNPPYKFNYEELENSYFEYNATDSLNVILGQHERNKKFTGRYNTLLGHNAGFSLFKGGNNNVMIGDNAGEASANIEDNVFVGKAAGMNVGDPSIPSSLSSPPSHPGEQNVALGSHAMGGRSTYSSSVAVGFSAMNLGEQEASVALGAGALQYNNGTSNIALGYEAALSGEGSSNHHNITIGYRAGYKNQYTHHNIIVGDSAAFENTAGENNIFVGHAAGITNKGSGNLIIGNGLTPSGNKLMAIGNQGKTLISGDFNTGEVTINNLHTDKLHAPKISAQSYHNTTSTLIDESATYTGPGGINTSGEIISNLTNTPFQTQTAIRADNGTVRGKYLWATSSVKVNTQEVIDASATFTGSGGINTTGAIQTSSTLSCGGITGESLSLSRSLRIGSIDIITPDAQGVAQERYALKSHSHNYAPIDHAHTQYAPIAHTHTSQEVAGTIPIGGIIMWSGKTDNIPSGWALCNGTQGTPDLRNRFIVGSGDKYWPADTGGNAEITLTKEQLPSHDHDAGSLALETLTTKMIYSNNNTLTDHENIGKGVVPKTIDIVGKTGAEGEGQKVNIMPPYYSMAYIMRIK